MVVIVITIIFLIVIVVENLDGNFLLRLQLVYKDSGKTLRRLRVWVQDFEPSLFGIGDAAARGAHSSCEGKDAVLTDLRYPTQTKRQH